MTKGQCIELMWTSHSEMEWNNNCNAVKAAHNRADGNDYPDYWFGIFVLGGLMNEIRRINKW